MRPEAVVFDIGNVLTTWDPEGFYDREIGPKRRKQLFAEVDLHGMNLTVDAGALFRETIYDWADRTPLWAPEIRMWYDRWIDLASPRINGSIALLRALRGKAVPVFALTNFGSYSYEEARTKLEFLNEFDREYVSGRMGVVKPDPAIYALTAERLGVPGSEIVFLDDFEANCLAAREAGWTAVRFADTAQTIAELDAVLGARGAPPGVAAPSAG